MVSLGSAFVEDLGLQVALVRQFGLKVPPIGNHRPERPTVLRGIAGYLLTELEHRMRWVSK